MAPKASPDNRATPLRAYVVIVIAIVATSSAAILIRLALDENMPPLLIAGSRLLIATLALTPIVFHRYRTVFAGLASNEMKLIALAGICLAIHFTAWVASLQYTTVLVSVVIVSTGPIWVAILEVFFLHVSLSRLVVLGLLVALLGGVIIGIPLNGALQAAQATGDLSGTIRGALLALLGALTVSVYLLIGRKLRTKLPVIPYIWLVYGVASICSILMIVITATPVGGFRPQGYFVLLAMGLVPQLLGHSSLNYLLEYFPAAMVSMFSQLEPIGSAILAVILFHELPPGNQIAGSAIIIVGVILASRGKSAHQLPEAAMRINLSAPSATHLWILVAVSAFAWSFGPICVRYAFQYDMHPALVSFGRMISGVIMFAPYIWYRGAREIAAMPVRSRWLALIAGAMSGLNIVLMIASLEHISVLINQAFIATIPIWVAFFEVTLLKQNLGRAVWVGIGSAFAGGVMIAFTTADAPAAVTGGNPTLGIAMAVISACSASLYIIVGRKVRGDVSFVPYIWLVYSAGAAVTLLIVAINGISLIGYDLRGYLWVLLLAVLAQIIGHGALNFALRFMSPTTLTMTVQSVPIMSAIWAFLIFSEIPTVPQVIGSLILVLGVTIVLRGQQQPKRRTD